MPRKTKPVVPDIWATRKTKIPPGTVPTSFTMTAAELREREILAWTERKFQDVVLEAARAAGFTLVYHTHDSRRSQPGFPDLVLVSPRAGRVLFRELKSTKGRVSPAQQKWGDGLIAAGADFAFWYPEDWASGRIQKELKGEA